MVLSLLHVCVHVYSEVKSVCYTEVHFLSFNNQYNSEILNMFLLHLYLHVQVQYMSLKCHHTVIVITQ